MGGSARSVLRWNQSATTSDTVTELATWSSSDTRVVTVDRGLISAVAPGTAMVTASYNGQLAWYGLSIPPPDR